MFLDPGGMSMSAALAAVVLNLTLGRLACSPYAMTEMGTRAPLSKSDHFADASLTFTGLACVRGGRMLFRGLDFTAAPGEICHVTGVNGIGKSSLIRIAAGLLRPFAGAVDTIGAVALSDEHLALDLHQPLHQALSFWASIDRHQRGARPVGGVVDDALAMMNITHLADIPVRIFSTGQRKRANLARILAMNAPIWLLDEPVNGLDTASAAALGTAMEAHGRNGGIVFAASHSALPLSAVQQVRKLALADFVP